MAISLRRLLTRGTGDCTGDLGYSLPELLMAITMAAAIAIIALPNAFALFHGYTLSVAAHELAAELQHARTMAVAGNLSIDLRCDAASGAYQLAETGSGPVAAEHFLPHRVRFQSLPRTNIRFHSRGSAAPAGTIVLEGPTGRLRVIISPAGRIRIASDGSVDMA
ncbi:MAG: GspH/FimT family protein [Acidobacteria bacterium]|nr:GspH/FimT family protein [Acidobacteriota bacterium]MBI3654971.1 GspH/FimT family protein [Acidobacteriota bacterium]